MGAVTRDDIEAVIREALTRHDAGRFEYGEIDLSTGLKSKGFTV